MYLIADERSDPIPAAFLPEPGLVVYHAFNERDTLAKTESASRSTLALEISVESGIPSEQHRLRATAMSGLLANFQSLVKNALRKAITKVDDKAKAGFTALSPMFDVAVPASPGSFRFVLVPAQQPDLFGGFDVIYGLDAIDYLLGSAADPQATLDRLKDYTGHTAGAFVRLIRFMVEQNLAIKYAWASPDREAVSIRTITQRETLPLLALLEATANLSIESVTITGYLRQVDENGAWRVEEVETKQSHSGKVRDGISLREMTTGHLYKFECEEEIEEVPATGKEIRKLYLALPPQELTAPTSRA